MLPLSISSAAGYFEPQEVIIGGKFRLGSQKPKQTAAKTNGTSVFTRNLGTFCKGVEANACDIF